MIGAVPQPRIRELLERHLSAAGTAGAQPAS
jgi:hypothetical protein